MNYKIVSVSTRYPLLQHLLPLILLLFFSPPSLCPPPPHLPLQPFLSTVNTTGFNNSSRETPDHISIWTGLQQWGELPVNSPLTPEPLSTSYSWISGSHKHPGLFDNIQRNVLKKIGVGQETDLGPSWTHRMFCFVFWGKCLGLLLPCCLVGLNGGLARCSSQVPGGPPSQSRSWALKAGPSTSLLHRPGYQFNQWPTDCL